MSKHISKVTEHNEMSHLRWKKTLFLDNVHAIYSKKSNGGIM